MDDYVIVMKVGPHSHMTLEEIIESKKEEEKIHGVHFWGYSGVFCQPAKVQDFCKKAKKENQKVHLILLETKSNYDSSIGYITQYSKDGIHYENFKGPVQLQGAQFSFVGKNIQKRSDFSLDNYRTIGGKNDNKPLVDHLKFRVNKSFAKKDPSLHYSNDIPVLEVELVEPYAIWLKE